MLKLLQRLSVTIGAAVIALSSVGTAPAQADVRVKLIYAHCCPPEHTYGIYAEQLAERVKENSNGEILIEILSGGVMGDEQAIAQKVQLGAIQMGGITSNNVAQLASSLNVLVLPYLTGGVQDLVGEGGLLRAGPYRDELNRRVLAESGSLRVIGGFNNGFRSVFAKNSCVSNIGNLAGLKIRAPQNRVMTAMWESWGVSTYPISWGETFGAVATGVVDSFDSPTEVILDMGFHEHIKFVTEMSYLPQAAVVIMNEQALQRLSEEDREVILRSAAEVDISHAEYVAKNEARVRNELIENHGVTFCKLEDPEVWSQRARDAWPQLYELVGGGEDWVRQTLDYLETGKI